MNAHIFIGTEIVAEYEVKQAALADAYSAFARAGDDLKSAATIRPSETGQPCEISPPPLVLPAHLKCPRFEVSLFSRLGDRR